MVDPSLPLLPQLPQFSGSPASLPARPEMLPEVREGPAEEERRAVEEVLDGLEELGDNLQAQQRQRLDEMQQVAVELAVTIASHLLQQRIETDDYPVEKLVRHVAGQLEPKHAVTVFLHPQDIALLESNLGRDGQALFDDGRSVRIVADAGRSRGECRAETGDISMLANLHDQLADIRNLLLLNLADAELERRKPGDQNLRRFPDRRQIA